MTSTENKKSNKGLIATIIILSALLVAGGVVGAGLLISGLNSKDSSSETKEEKKDEPKKGSAKKDEPVKKTDTSEHARGKLDSSVEVVEYADMQCPGCASMMPKMDKLYEKYGDQVKFVFRHYPISSHRNAKFAAIATEAAAQQGFFWEMVTAMYSNQIDWVYEESGSDGLEEAIVGIFKDVAGKKGDVEKFKSDLNKTALAAKVENDKRMGTKDRINATPTIMVNGEEVKFAGSLDDVVDSIEDMIEDALDED